MRKCIIALALVAILGGIAYADYTYAFYYDRSPGRDLEFNIFNPMPNTASYTVAVYDAYGDRACWLSGTLSGYDSTFYTMSEHTSASGSRWGIAVVSSTQRLVIGLEYKKDGALVSIDNIYREVPDLSPGVPYWAGGYYCTVGNSDTLMILLNPTNSYATVSWGLYDQSGDLIFADVVTLRAHESEYVLLGQIAGSSTYSWGFVDIMMEDAPVIVAMEYTGRGADGLEIDNITEPYY